MFTLEQIQAAHAKVKSGADFPAYASELKALGLDRYEFHLKDGHAEYFGNDGQQLHSEPRWQQRDIGSIEPEKFKSALSHHQKGGSDFPTFVSEASKYGVLKWTVNLLSMNCTYYSSDGSAIFVEDIPRTSPNSGL